jgi:hypothetical protein
MSTDKMAVDEMTRCQEVIALTAVLISKYGLGKKLFLIISLFIFWAKALLLQPYVQLGKTFL